MFKPKFNPAIFNGFIYHFFLGLFGQGIKSACRVRLCWVCGNFSSVGPLPTYDPEVTYSLADMSWYFFSSSPMRSSRDFGAGSTPSTRNYVSDQISVAFGPVAPKVVDSVYLPSKAVP